MSLGSDSDCLSYFSHPLLRPTPLPTPFHQSIPRTKKTSGLEEFMAGEEKPHSECCSRCQSGWTLYLDRSQSQNLLTNSHSKEVDNEDDDDDLSMLSDASSGPPHVHDEEDNTYSSCCDGENGCLCNASFLPLIAMAKNGSKRRRPEEEQRDDTASSTLFHFSKVTESSDNSSNKHLMEDKLSCFSTTHFRAP